MENYTIDLAQLGQEVSGAPKIGMAQDTRNMAQRKERGSSVSNGGYQSDADDERDFMDGYRIDLAALGEQPSSVVVEGREQRRDVVGSEDDGPEDFTVNLEKWMSGAKEWEKERDVFDKDSNDRKPFDQARQAAEDEQDGRLADESAFEPLGTSTPLPVRKNHSIIEEGVQREARVQAPPLTRSNTEMLQDKAAEDVSDQISLLQAEVGRMRSEGDSRRKAYEAMERENAILKQEAEHSRRRLAARERAMKDKFEELQKIHFETKSLLQHQHTQLRGELEEALERLRVFEDTPMQYGSDLEPLRMMYEEAIQELESCRARKEFQTNTSDGRTEALEAELAAARNESAILRSEIESVEQQYSSRVQELTTELEAKKNEVANDRKESVQRANDLAESEQNHVRRTQALEGEIQTIKIKLEYAEKQHTETHRILNSIEEENDRLLQQNERQAEEIGELENSNPSLEPTGTHNILDIEAISQKHESELSALKTSQDKAITTLRSALQKAATTMQKREEKIRCDHQAEVTSLNQQIARINEKSIKSVQQPDPAMENELRSAIRVLNTKLKHANAALAAARSEATNAKTQLNQIREDNESINKEVDARMQANVDAREEEWLRRWAAVLKERETMQKALMIMWGREEFGSVGMGEKQRYRYRYVRKPRI